MRVRGPKFEVLELRTRNFEFRVALFSSVSLESDIGDCSRNAHESCGLDHLLTGEEEYVKREGIVLLSYPFFRFQAREPIDEAVGKLF
jgi:hypothetical protein